jgi:hypothetical protein
MVPKDGVLLVVLSLQTPDPAVMQACKGVPLNQLGLVQIPKRADGTPVDWAEGIRDSWHFGEDQALHIFEEFCRTGMNV